jgi:uncharacterized membrane protein YagU involved in acid resistance
MSAKGNAMLSAPRAMLRTIVIAGFTAGTIDIAAACLINMRSPQVILQAIASGLLGRASFQDGAFSAVLGLFLQWAMSCLIAAVYVMAARRIALLRRNWIVSGVAFGCMVFIVMNYVVVPLSAIGHTPKFSAASFAENLLAMVLFGLIIAFIDRPERA